MKNKATLLVLLFISFSGMAQQQSASVDHDWFTAHERNYYCQSFGFEVPQQWNKRLYDTLENWMGTPYKWAGGNHEGTDCSGFVNALYMNVYQNNIGARQSADIYSKILKVDKDELCEGDLVFFRIRKKRISHVGLYLGDNKFVHASSSNGVIISDLKDPYYRKYYAGGGRLPFMSAANK